MEAGMITTVLLVACATICIGVGIFYFFINNSDYLQKARKYGHFTGYKN